MSFKNVQAALDTRLSTLTTAVDPIAVAWEGTNFEPVVGETFIRTTNITTVSDQLDLANSAQDNVGIYQIDVFYPLNGQGTGPMLDIISDIYNHFKGSLTLTSGGTKVYIRNISRLPTVKSEDTWMIGGIQVNYTSYF